MLICFDYSNSRDKEVELNICNDFQLHPPRQQQPSPRIQTRKVYQNDVCIIKTHILCDKRAAVKLGIKNCDCH